MKVSVCITTYNRPAYLKLAIESCLNQTLLPYEIIIGDDSNNDDTAIMIKKLPQNCDVVISYHHHKPALKQAENTNFVYKHAKGDKLILLHDDDLLMPEAIETLSGVFKTNSEIDVVYGNQYFISDSGIVDFKNSPKYNKYYFRENKNEGSVLESLEACILQQLPSNGYMIKAEIATTVLWRSRSNLGNLGNGNELDWVLRLGLSNPKMYYIDKYLSKYRETAVSNSTTNNDDAYKCFFLLKELQESKKHNKKYNKIITKALVRMSALAIVQALRFGNKKDAFNIFFSKYHFARVFTLGFYKRFLLLLSSFFKEEV